MPPPAASASSPSVTPWASQTVILAGVGTVIVGPAFVWAGTRRFASRSIPPAMLLAGLIAWLVVILVPLPEAYNFVRTLFGFVPATVYLSASA